MSDEPTKAELQADLAKAGLELAQYASYAEIVGGIRQNRSEIRRTCDEVFRLNGLLQRIKDAEEDALAGTVA